MKRSAFLLLGLLLLVPLVLPQSFRAAQPETKKKTVRLLTIGNSFSQDATRLLPNLVKESGHTLLHRPLVIGGASMQVHWDKAMLHEKDPKDPKGLYKDKGLKEELAAESWDYVTIQQASIKSHEVATYRPYAKQLYDYIKKHAPKAEILLHETWAYRVDDPRFAATATAEPKTQKAMYEGLKKSYETIAAELGLRIIPVGDAMFRADTDPKWGYRPDKQFQSKEAKSPALPNQTHSLHVGQRWTKGKDGKTALTMDGHHASVAGQYLGACVFYEVLFGEAAVGNGYAPKDVEPAYVRFLQETAHQAVAARQAEKQK